MEQLPQVILRFLSVLKFFSARPAVVAAGDGNPLAGNVISHSLHACSNHAVLRDLLKSAITDKRGDGVLPHVEGVLLKAGEDHIETAHRVECGIHR